MKKKLIYTLILVLTSMHFVNAQNLLENPWTLSQLMAPADLAEMMRSKNKSVPVILNIGVVNDIKGARHIGGTSEAVNLTKLKKAVSKISKDSLIVIYCGCCPFDKCPNIRPAFSFLKKEGFANSFLLNLPQNIKVDWIDKGFPLAKD